MQADAHPCCCYQELTYFTYLACRKTPEETAKILRCSHTPDPTLIPKTLDFKPSTLDPERAMPNAIDPEP
eukprot:956481-Rhodomonas_salina.1